MFALEIQPAVSHYSALRMAPTTSKSQTNGKRRGSRPRCEDCFFHQNMLCALGLTDGCPTFRPAHPEGLRPPQQLSFVFRQEPSVDAIAFQPPAY